MPINGYLGGVISATAPSVTTAGASGVFTLEEQLQAAGQNNWPGYQISRSVRLRSSASAYFSRTLSTPTNNKIWTFSCWFKRGQLTYGASGASGALFFAPSSGSTFAGIYFTPSDYINWYDASGGATVYFLQIAPVFRDPSAWYHIVCAYDSTQATDSNRQKIYINGVQITTFNSGGQTYVAQNTNGRFNSAVAHDIGKLSAAGPYYFDGQMTEINFIDGQALTPASFGVTDTVTGVWNPIRYTGTYGNNGFYLNYSDNSSNTATTIGKDYSGNGNNWTPNNISVTAGTTYDSMVDVPIGYGSDTGVGGELRGNYPTFNPIDVSTGSTAQTITQGNLTLFSSSSTRIDGAYSTFSVKSGKWYVEMTLTTRTNDYPGVGWSSTSFNSTGSGWQYQAGTSSNPSGASIDPFGRLGLNATQSGGSYFGSGGTWAQGDIIQVAVDIDNKLIWFGKAGSWSGTAGNMNGNPATGTNGTSFSAQGGTEFKFQSCVGDSAKGDVNFGQRAFSYTAPTGFQALCTQNLPTPTISNGANYMAATIWTGTGTNPRTFTGLAFKPDLIWNKSRSNNGYGALWDSVRGGTKALQTYSPTDENTIGDAGGSITSFNSDGATFANGSVNDSWFNSSAVTYVNWQWKASGSTVSNTAGSITSTVNANTTAGFSILTYTGNGTVGATVGHGLGVTPGMVIVKSRSTSQDWPMKILPYMTGGQRLELNTTNASTTEAAGSGSLWNATNPNSTVITLGNQAMTNANGTTYVAYCWAQITGYSAFGSYTGNGSSDGPFVYCGFRPRWVMVKDTVNVTYWILCDSSRNTYNVVDGDLYPNASFAEAADPSFDFLANGFKVRKAGGNFNNSGAATIYAAFAENPFNISRAR